MNSSQFPLNIETDHSKDQIVTVRNLNKFMSFSKEEEKVWNWKQNSWHWWANEAHIDLE